MKAVDELAVARTLASLSTREIANALGQGRRSTFRHFVALAARRASARLGHHLARFDALVAEDGIAHAARVTLATLGARVDVVGKGPRGPALVVINHPGAFDALALMAALERTDTFLLAADRAFLRAMPHVAERLVFIPDGAVGRAAALRRAQELLRAGSALIHFGAGAIEPDIRFDRGDDVLLPAWPAGTGALALAAVREGAVVVPAFVAGVHSPRAKRLAIVRWAERRGVTTVAPLVQATFPGFRDVHVSIAFGAPVESRALVETATVIERTEVVRSAIYAIGQSVRAQRNSSVASDQVGSVGRARDAASLRRVRAV